MPRGNRSYDDAWVLHRETVAAADSGDPAVGNAAWQTCAGRVSLAFLVSIEAGTGTYSLEVWLKDDLDNMGKSPNHDLVAMTQGMTDRVDLDGDYKEFLIWVPALTGITDIDIGAKLG